MKLGPSMPRIIDPRSYQTQVAANRQYRKMAGIAGHQLHHQVIRGLLLIGEQVLVLRVYPELVVYISVLRKVLRYPRDIHLAGYGLTGIEHEEAIGAPNALKRLLWGRTCLEDLPLELMQG